MIWSILFMLLTVSLNLKTFYRTIHSFHDFVINLLDLLYLSIVPAVGGILLALLIGICLPYDLIRSKGVELTYIDCSTCINKTPFLITNKVSADQRYHYKRAGGKYSEWNTVVVDVNNEVAVIEINRQGGEFFVFVDQFSLLAQLIVIDWRPWFNLEKKRYVFLIPKGSNLILK